MLTIFKDAAHSYPALPQRPLTFMAPEAGITKELSIWIVASGLTGAYLQIEPVGGDQAQFPVMLRPGGLDWIPGASWLSPVITHDGQSVSIPISIACPAGAAGVFPALGIRVTALLAGVAVEVKDAPCLVIRRDQGIKARFRALPANRTLRPTLPGFRFGEYRWRSQDGINGRQLVPTDWNIDPVLVGTEKFLAGIGYRADLELVGLERPVDPGTDLQGHSVFPRIRHGFYFTGHEGYFYPSKDAVLMIVPATAGVEFSIPRRPSQQPVFVGTYRRDDHGYYDTDISYRCLGKGAFDAADPGPQFTLNRTLRTIKLNRPMEVSPVFAGFAPVGVRAIIDVPVYPILPGDITGAYLDDPSHPCILGTFDANNNTQEVIFPIDPLDSPEDHVGRGIYLTYVPSLVVLYEAVPATPSSADGTMLLSSTDLNPAFSGLSRGYLYLMHRKHKPGAITLFADKPRILVPKTFDSIVGMVAFGPTYFESDYALLMASVTGDTAQEVIPNVRLRVIPGADFQGFINYQDPVATHVEVVSGGDGNASFVYTPAKTYGFYLDAAAIAGTVLTLPEPVALTQLWNADEHWLPTTYIVRDDHPYLGKVNANTAFGEVPWQTWGTPGSIGYRTNGMRQVLRDATGSKVFPVQAHDAAGHPALIAGSVNPAFSGTAVTLTYASNLVDPAASNVGAYFISFIGRIRIQVQDVASGLISNTILLQLESPPEIQDAPAVAGYLYLNMAEDIKQGRLNANRLGGAPIPQFSIIAPRY